MADAITANLGNEADTAAIGKGNTQQSNRQRSDPRQNQRSDPQQNVNFTNPDNMTLWFKLIELSSDVRDLMVNVRDLMVKMDDLPNRVGRLEKVEVVVQPAPVAVIPPPPDSLNLSMRAILTIFGVALLAVVVLVGFLIYMQVS